MRAGPTTAPAPGETWKEEGMRSPALRRLSGLLAPAALVATLGTCAVNPVTGKRELSLVSESQEIQMGQEYSAQVRQQMGVYPDSAVQAYVNRLGREIAAGTERPRLPWSFTVIDDPTVNAFALPGGPVFVTRGILTHMTSEAELAAVLGHEIGHVTARHSVQQMTRQQLAQIGLLAGAIASDRVAQNLGVISQGLGILFLKYSRDDETQADGLGFRYALNDGYDVRQMVNMFAVLQRISAQAGQRIPEWQSTHPDPGNRIERTRERLAKVTVPLDGKKVGRDEFLRKINGMVFGDNPRQGYFQGRTFLHPDLAFQLEFPSGWKTLNQPQAVLGASPNQDAQVQLALAGEDPPAQTLQKFLGQQGVQAGRSSQTTINGNTAALARFTAQNQEGTQLAGLAAFVAYGGNTYQLMGITTGAAYAGYDRDFQQFVQSFRRLTDAAALNVKPNRIELVKTPRAMTLADFNRQYPSAIPVEQLALINGLDDGNSQIAAGELVKRVVAK
jgi:predicted Zn-dependent protease